MHGPVSKSFVNNTKLNHYTSEYLKNSWQEDESCGIPVYIRQMQSKSLGENRFMEIFLPHYIANRCLSEAMSDGTTVRSPRPLLSFKSNEFRNSLYVDYRSL